MFSDKKNFFSSVWGGPGVRVSPVSIVLKWFLLLALSSLFLFIPNEAIWPNFHKAAQYLAG